MADIRSNPEGPLGSVAYVVVLAELSILIDPSVPPEKIIGTIPPVAFILATHGHIDHIAAADHWRDQTGASLLIHQDDADCLTDPSRNLSMILGQTRVFRPAENHVTDQQIIDLDETYRICVWHTPGHSAGSVCYLLEEENRPIALFSGDTLFCRSIGRTDLGGDSAQMVASLSRLGRMAKERQLTEENDLAVYPGHGPQTWLLNEIKRNPHWPSDR